MFHSASQNTHREAETPVVETRLPFSVITKRAIIKSVPDAFERQYGHARDANSWRRNISRGEMIDALKALDVETCGAEAVNAIIGNDSWTDNKCDACGKDCETLIRIGEEPDYEARWQDLCGGCLSRASAMLAEATPTPSQAHGGYERSECTQGNSND